MSVLVYVEHKNGRPAKASLGALNLAATIAQAQSIPYHAVVVGKDPAEAAQALAAYGCGQVFTVAGDAFDPFLSEAHTTATLAAAEQCGAQWVLGAATASGKDFLPRLAAKLGAGMVSDVIGFDAAHFAFERPIFAGKLKQRVAIDSPRKVLSVRGTAFEPLAPAGGASPVVALTVDTSAALKGKRFVALHESKSDRPELTEAAVVVSGGRSLGSHENFEKVIYPLADALGAAVGATRAAVDSGYMPNDLQVGQTGKVVAPQLYFAIGISGAIQHLAGMKDSKVIVAINKDADAPIFQVADYALVADLFKVTPELTEAVKAAKAG